MVGDCGPNAILPMYGTLTWAELAQLVEGRYVVDGNEPEQPTEPTAPTEQPANPFAINLTPQDQALLDRIREQNEAIAAARQFVEEQPPNAVQWNGGNITITFNTTNATTTYTGYMGGTTTGIYNFYAGTAAPAPTYYPLWNTPPYQPARPPRPRPLDYDPNETPQERNARFAAQADERRRRQVNGSNWEETGELTADEIAEMREKGYITIPSSLYSNRVYRIPYRSYTMVEIWQRRGRGEYIEWEDVAHICLQPTDGDLTDPQWVSLQKMLLLADEERYLRSANHFEHSVRYRRERRYQNATPDQRYSGARINRHGDFVEDDDDDEE